MRKYIKTQMKQLALTTLITMVLLIKELIQLDTRYFERGESTERVTHSREIIT